MGTITEYKCFNCQGPVDIIMTKKQGENFGKEFIKCSAKLKDGCADYFEWREEYGKNNEKLTKKFSGGSGGSYTPKTPGLSVEVFKTEIAALDRRLLNIEVACGRIAEVQEDVKSIKRARTE